MSISGHYIDPSWHGRDGAPGWWYLFAVLAVVAVVAAVLLAGGTLASMLTPSAPPVHTATPLPSPTPLVPLAPRGG